MSGYPDPNKPQYNPYGEQPQYPQQGGFPQQQFPQQNYSQQPDYSSSGSDSGGSGAWGWLIWIGVIIGLNIMSAVFDWGWYFY